MCLSGISIPAISSQVPGYLILGRNIYLTLFYISNGDGSSLLTNTVAATKIIDLHTIIWSQKLSACLSSSNVPNATWISEGFATQKIFVQPPKNHKKKSQKIQKNHKKIKKSQKISKNLFKFNMGEIVTIKKSNPSWISKYTTTGCWAVAGTHRQQLGKRLKY